MSAWRISWFLPCWHLSQHTSSKINSKLSPNFEPKNLKHLWVRFFPSVDLKVKQSRESSQRDEVKVSRLSNQLHQTSYCVDAPEPNKQTEGVSRVTTQSFVFIPKHLSVLVTHLQVQPIFLYGELRIHTVWFNCCVRWSYLCLRIYLSLILTINTMKVKIIFHEKYIFDIWTNINNYVLLILIKYELISTMKTVLNHETLHRCMCHQDTQVNNCVTVSSDLQPYVLDTQVKRRAELSPDHHLVISWIRWQRRMPDRLGNPSVNVLWRCAESAWQAPVWEIFNSHLRWNFKSIPRNVRENWGGKGWKNCFTTLSVQRTTFC